MKLVSLILLVWSFHNDEVACQVKFSVYNAGVEVTGTIDSVRAIVRFDPSNLGGSYIEAWAAAATLNTGMSIRDNHLKRKDYFDVEEYPLIRIKSKGFRKAGRNKIIGNFDLTIKNISRSVAVSFTIKNDGSYSIHKGTFVINRLDFDLGEESVILENNVVVDIVLVNRREP